MGLRERLRSVLPSDRNASDDPTGAPATDPWPYVWSEDAVERVEGEPVRSLGTDDRGDDVVFAGPLARRMFATAATDPDEPVYVGVGTRRGRHAAIERQYLRRHCAIFGTTGYGKSTLLRVMARQLHGNAGLAFFDPKGDDSVKLMQVIAPDRLDDVVWIEPGRTRSAETGFNFLDVGVSPEHPMYPTLETNVVDDLVQMIGLDDYWGPRMDGICRNLVRATARMEQSFTLLDLYFIIATEANRERYAEMVSAAGHRFMSIYAEKIAQMDDDDLDAIRRRLQRWVEDPLARQLISFRDASLDIESIVSEGKLMIVRMGAASEDLKGMVGTALIRRLWSTIRARAEQREADRDTFYITVDEADLVLREDSGVLSILSKGRSLGASFTVCCQQPAQLPDGIVSGIYGNCDTVLSFSPGSPADARDVAKNLDMDPQTLRKEANYHLWMQVTLSETRERSDPFRVYAFPQPPAVRSEAAALHAIERAVRRDGRPHRSDAEQLDEVVISDGNVAADLDMADGGDGTGGGVSAGVDLDDSAIRGRALKAVYDAQLAAGDAGASGVDRCAVALDDVRGRLERYLATVCDADLHDGAVQDVIERLCSHGLERHRTSEGVRYAVGEAALADLFATGSAASAGGETHRWTLRRAYDALTRYGMDVTLVTQDGGPEVDALGDLPVDVGVGGDGSGGDTINPRAALDRLESEYPVLHALTGGAPVAIEAECSTASKPGQTCRNLAQAVGMGRHCLFVVPDGGSDGFTHTAERVVATLTEPPLLKARSPERYYLVGDWTTAGGQRIYRPDSGARTDWRREDGALVLGDESGAVVERFEDAETALAPTAADLATCRCGEAPDDWVGVQRPFLPTEHVDGEVSGAGWSVVIVPNDDRGREPAAYRDGAAVGLSDLPGHEDADDGAGEEGDEQGLAGLVEDLERV